MLFAPGHFELARSFSEKAINKRPNRVMTFNTFHGLIRGFVHIVLDVLSESL